MLSRDTGACSHENDPCCSCCGLSVFAYFAQGKKARNPGSSLLQTASFIIHTAAASHFGMALASLRLCVVLLNPKSYTQGYKRIVRAKQQQQQRQGKAKHWFVGQGILRIDKLPRLCFGSSTPGIPFLTHYNFPKVFLITSLACVRLCFAVARGGFLSQETLAHAHEK